MRILLVADHPDDARAVEAALTGDGHSVTTCNDRSGGPCRGVEHFDECPLESSVDLAVIARSSHGRRGIEEMGSVCASRHRVGVVEIDPSAPGDRSIYELADEAEREMCRGYALMIRDSFGDLRQLREDESFDVHVTRRDRDVHVWITLGFEASPLEISAVADRARASARHHDRFARVIDVSVQRDHC